jgi:putative membrane protein
MYDGDRAGRVEHTLQADNMTGWGWMAMTITAIVFSALLIAVVAAFAYYAHRSVVDRFERHVRPTPEQLLAERYARGEIDEAEYRRGLDTLKATGAAHGSTSGR